jgi:hypothetical protein
MSVTIAFCARSIHMARHTLAAAAVLALAVAPALARATEAQPAGRALLLVPNARGAMHVSPDAHTSFALPAGQWVQVPPRPSDTPSYGSYRRAARVHGRTCALDLGVGGQAQDRRPTLKRFGRVENVRRGRIGNLRWLVAFSPAGPSPTLYATAYRPAPRWATTKRWTSFTMEVSVSAGRTRACDRLRSRTDLVTAIRSVAVRRGGVSDGAST